ncbi:hypothetical protein [Streptomyces sp. NPDC101150]|uniref:hypothetical protein n=1 Tax=Streptomyces sp. NPDC101150 TaxID=3366114 RepID=UPI00381F5BD3
MIHPAETLALQTVEDFLTGDELSQLRKILDVLPRDGAASGRRELEHLRAPEPADEILQEAFRRALPAIQQVMPSVARAAPWHYAALTVGKEVPTHLDGILNAGAPPRRLGRIGVVLTDAEEGGEFYVATTSSPNPWTDTVLGEADGYRPALRLARGLPREREDVREYRESAQWIDHTPQTRWRCDAPAGVAVAYGAHLIHGVTHVRKGTLRKFITDLLDA